MVCAAVCRRLPVAWSSPVFKLRSKRGKLLEVEPHEALSTISDLIYHLPGFQLNRIDPLPTMAWVLRQWLLTLNGAGEDVLAVLGAGDTKSYLLTRCLEQTV
jgi:hypothetical protein